ncbi:dockerin type I domain-containing protein [Neorhodopirellula pilleata]|uniref:Dockerin type I repeat protein n=1 Tax=Neorhodopirellula pilleata TaxID=2714738 RepID=A0A5C5ZNF4_9BACT|nr:dockerin type I domain-containing protein [Neorhodopirellula pilleata]TWT87973.1 Dockerin type I repeat protein [Neorhodopirellula pilleata]
MMAADSVHFKFDYSKDTGFFSGPNFFRRALLEEAGRILTDRLSDDLAAVPASTPSLSWQGRIVNPSTGALEQLPSTFAVQQNEIVVFAGGRDLSGKGADTRAFADGIQDISFNCVVADAACFAFRDVLIGRGETGALATTPTDFGPIVASISFDTRNETTERWNFEDKTLDESQFRFLSFAVHELAHVLGHGIAPSFVAKAGGGQFSGTEANRIYTGPGVLPLDGLHINASVFAFNPTIMSPFIPNELFSDLDFAVLQDIGWKLIPDSRPTVTLTNSSAFVYEGDADSPASSVTVTAMLSQPSATPIQVPISLTGVASTNADVSLSASTFSFAANQTTASITINVVADDINETTEAVTLDLANSASADLGTNTSFRLTIFDDDGVNPATAPRLSLSPTANSVNIPGDNQPHALLFRATRSGTLRVNAAGVDQISEAVILIDRSGNRLGTLGSTGISAAEVVSGQSYALLFYSRSTPRTFNLELPGGFASGTAETRTNILLPADVTGDGQVLASDALRIINQLNTSGESISVDSTSLVGDEFFDVSGDGVVTPVDALQVINFLIIQDGFNGEPLIAGSPFHLADDDETDDPMMLLDQVMATVDLF